MNNTKNKCPRCGAPLVAVAAHSAFYCPGCFLAREMAARRAEVPPILGYSFSDYSNPRTVAMDVEVDAGAPPARLSAHDDDYEAAAPVELDPETVDFINEEVEKAMAEFRARAAHEQPSPTATPPCHCIHFEAMAGAVHLMTQCVGEIVTNLSLRADMDMEHLRRMRAIDQRTKAMTAAMAAVAVVLLYLGLTS